MTDNAGVAAGLYLHIPFCSAICPYCDFAVQVAPADKRATFVDSLLAEVELWRDSWPHPIDTIYFGGGTPSLLATEDLIRLVEAAKSALPVTAAPRLFLEANPEDVTTDRVAAWRDARFDVVSLGVQSFDDATLKRLGRRHNGQDAIAAVEACMRGGFDVTSVDLMFGLPEQSLPSWRSDLDVAAALMPEHISCYQLTIHEGTTFGRWAARGKLAEMPEDTQADFYALTHAVLAAGGWDAYEVSNFARAPQHRSAHNRKYWRHVPYLGLGPAAHSFDGSKRWWNVRSTDAYNAKVLADARPIDSEETLTRQDLALETVMLALRTVDGIDLTAFKRDFGVALYDINRAYIDASVAEGLLLCDEVLRPTRAGLAVADGLVAALRLD